MVYDIQNFETRAKEVTGWLEKEYMGIRTGQASPMLLDKIQVESYGANVPLQQVGNVSIEDPRTLRVSVWDASQVKAVETAITEADLGVSVSADSSGLRVIFPELTGERREQLLKLAKSKHEEARVSLRGARDDAIKEIEKLEKDGEMSEDERFDAKEKIQKSIDAHNKTLDEIFASKEKEITA